MPNKPIEDESICFACDDGDHKNCTLRNCDCEDLRDTDGS